MNNIIEIFKKILTSMFGSKKKTPKLPEKENVELEKENENTKAPIENTKVPIEIITKPETKMDTPKNFYALIVGINDYQFVGKLGGCVNDANRMNDYFKKVTDASDCQYHPLLLTDAQATKQNVIDGFLNHLAKAGKDDIALFYYSGHGAQEEGDAVWSKTESDNGLETMVCYDSRDNKGTPDLADKELRYLIHKVAQKKPHILVISDSCHSGDNTRSELVKRRLPDENEVGEARLSNLAPMRSWEKFCFANVISRDAVKNANDLAEIFPQGQHIQIAACKDKELAYELRGSGVFTSMLLNVLERSNGDISYADLKQRIRHSITGKYPQVPQIYASSGDATELQAAFLGGAAVKEPFYYNVQKNFKTSTGWTLSIGAIHGMPTNTNANLEIQIRDTNDKSKILTTATVKSVEPGVTKIEIKDETKLDAAGQYFATIPKLFTEPLRMYLHGDANGVKILQDRIAKDTDFEYANLAVTKDLVLADYLVYAKKGKTTDYYFIGLPLSDLGQIDNTQDVTFPNDNFKTTVPYWKWLTEQQEGFTPGSADQIINFMKVASNWHFLKKLNNPNTQLKNHGIEVIINHLPNKNFADKKRLTFNDSVSKINFDQGSIPTAWFTIDIKNNSDKTYSIAAPALFNAFEVYTDVMTSGVVEINPGETKQAFGGSPISIELPDRVEGEMNWWIKEFNWSHKSWWLKLIVSTDDFSVLDFARQPLPYPKSDRSTRSTSRGFGNIGTPSNVPLTSDWTTELFEIQITNPFFVLNSK